MQQKMQQHYYEKQKECDKQSMKILADLDSLVKNVKDSREQFTKDSAQLDQQLKAIKSNQDREIAEAHKATLPPQDLTEALKSHRLRCEVERAFYFHVTYELLKQRFGAFLITSNKEQQLFEKMGQQLSLPALTNNISQELKDIQDARLRFESLPDKDRIIQSRKESSILYKSGSSTRMTLANKQADEE